jgi:arginine decarboxylase
MLATVLGVEFNPNSSWDEKREIWKIADVIFKTKEVTQTAIGHKDGLWSTVVAAAILLP